MKIYAIKTLGQKDLHSTIGRITWLFTPISHLDQTYRNTKTLTKAQSSNNGLNVHTRSRNTITITLQEIDYDKELEDRLEEVILFNIFIYMILERQTLWCNNYSKIKMCSLAKSQVGPFKQFL